MQNDIDDGNHFDCDTISCLTKYKIPIDIMIFSNPNEGKTTDLSLNTILFFKKEVTHKSCIVTHTHTHIVDNNVLVHKACLYMFISQI